MNPTLYSKLMHVRLKGWNIHMLRVIAILWDHGPTEPTNLIIAILWDHGPTEPTNLIADAVCDLAAQGYITVGKKARLTRKGKLIAQFLDLVS